MASPSLHRFSTDITYAATMRELKKKGDLVAQRNEESQILEVHRNGFTAKSTTSKVTGASFFLPYRSASQKCHDYIVTRSSTVSSTDCRISGELQNKMTIQCPICTFEKKHVIGIHQDHTLPTTVPPEMRPFGDHYTVYPCETMPLSCFNQIVKDLTPTMCPDSGSSQDNQDANGNASTDVIPTIASIIMTIPTVSNSIDPASTHAQNRGSPVTSRLHTSDTLADELIQLMGGEPGDDDAFCMLEALCFFVMGNNVSVNDRKAALCLCEILCLSTPTMKEITEYGRLAWVAYRSLFEYAPELQIVKEKDICSRLLQLFEDELEGLADYWLLSGTISNFNDAQYKNYIASTSPSQFVQALADFGIGDHHTIEYAESSMEKRLIAGSIQVTIPCAGYPLTDHNRVQCNGETVYFDQARKITEFCPSERISSQEIVMLIAGDIHISIRVNHDWMSLHHRWIPCQQPGCKVWAKDTGLCSAHRWA